jgi:hypothetical protein
MILKNGDFRGDSHGLFDDIILAMARKEGENKHGKSLSR